MPLSLSLSQYIVKPTGGNWHLARRGERLVAFNDMRLVDTTYRISVPGTYPRNEEKALSNISRDKKTVPEADPPSIKDVHLLYEFLD